MPTKDHNPTQLLFKTENGEYQPIEMGVSLEDLTEIVSDVDSALSNLEYFKGGEITMKMSRKAHKKFKKLIQDNCPRYFTNNWRKMHHLPLIRRRGKRK